MTGPFIYVGTTGIKQGKLDEARQHIAELIDFIETNEPRMIAFHCFFDEEGSQLTVIQVHLDSESMEFHMQVNAKHFTTAFEYLESQISDQYYGLISDALADELRKWEDPNVPVTRMPVHAGGFTRLSLR